MREREREREGSATWLKSLGLSFVEIVISCIALQEFGEHLHYLLTKKIQKLPAIKSKHIVSPKRYSGPLRSSKKSIQTESDGRNL